MLFFPCRLFLCVRLTTVRLASRSGSRDVAVVPAGPLSSSSPPSPSSSSSSLLDHHRKLSAEAAALRHDAQSHLSRGESGASGAAHAAAEQIERRRQKWTVAEAEFDAGITERLFPEIRRLPVLHELHYGDAVMREVDSALYFAARREENSESDAAVALSDADFLEFESDAMENASGAAKDSADESAPNESVANFADEPVAAVAHGILTPSFVPTDGVVRYEAMSPSDAACLLSFVMRLREQSAEDLPGTVRAKLRSHSLALEDVMHYMDTAPVPVIGFSADLPPRESPAFVFVLYTENVSLHNAIGHMAALFGIPQRSFVTRTAGSKMSCASVLCAVEANRLCREHLLLLNTMRHPGFVLRVSSIREWNGTSRDMFAQLAHWQPVHEVELLLRRVTCRGGAEEIAHRLRAVRDVGAVFFCANREASLARAATDVLHGFLKSALLNALHRRHAPLAMRLFLARPNRITAARALRVAADPTVRHVLRQFIRVNGDWAQTLTRVPYAWRRRWLNALRSAVWNQMASRRMRRGGRRVMIGDIVLRGEFRHDAHRRGIATVKAEHVMLVRSAAEAEACSVEDIYIPFLRGTYPTELFAPEETAHPIMTRTSMLTLLREAHAPQLLLGMGDMSRALLDTRSETAPLLFRRFMARPLEMRFTVLEDKPPVGATHFDAARILSNDRLDQQEKQKQYGLPRGEETQSATGDNDALHTGLHVAPRVFASSLVSQAAVLERTTLGSRMPSGVLPEEFFTPPAREDYAALSHVCRRANGGGGGEFVLAAPQANSDALHAVDRVYSVHVHAVVRHGAAALAQMLREYFLLSGVEREEDSALQHKIHRVRRELDAETARITAPHFCTSCFCRSHDSREECAEFQRKRGAQIRRQRRADAVAALAVPAGGDEKDEKDEKGVREGGEIVWDVRLRRRSGAQKWGIRISAALRLTGIDDPTVIASGSLESSLPSLSSSASFSSETPSRASALPLGKERSHATTADLTALCDSSSALSQFIAAATGGEAVPLGSPLPHLSDAIARHTNSSAAESTCTTLPLRRCAWTLSAVNGTLVRNRRDVAAVFVRCGEEREVTLRFAAAVPHVALSRSGVCRDKSDSSGLPSSLHVELTREKAQGGRGWGLRLGEDTLAVQNLSTVLLSSASAVRPPLEAKPELDGRYAVRRIDNVAVRAMGDVVRLIHQSIPCENESGTETLRLELGLLSPDVQGSGTQNSLGLTTETTPADRKDTHNNNNDDDDYYYDNKGKDDNGGSMRVKEKDVESETSATGALTAEKELPPSPPRPCSSQCKPLSPEQQRKGLITLVVNRSHGAPVGRWGLRVQRDSVRLLRVQHNHHFTFQVYAAKQSQAVRVSDTLRYNSIRRRGTSPASSSTVAFASQFLYMIIGVNGERVENAAELRAALAAAPGADALVLQLRQHRLAHIALRVERGSGAEPVGLHVARDMSVVGIAHGSPMARAVVAATHTHCSLRGLIANANAAGGAGSAWQFDLDEDDEPNASGEAHAHWDMSDGAAVMAAYGGKAERGTERSGGERFAWRLVYAAGAGPLRQAEDIARAFGAEVTDETVFIQQCVMDETDG